MTTEKSENNPRLLEFKKKVSEAQQSLIIKTIERIFEERGDVWSHIIAKRLEDVTAGITLVPGDQLDNWEPIESLSKLRALVGGRFQNLRDRWVKAGFPLREHRGDRAGEVSLSEEGWTELAGWLLEHGYESRICNDQANVIFEIRKGGG